MKQFTPERSKAMFRRIYRKRLLVAGLGLAALAAPSAALGSGSGSTHNMSSTAYQSTRYGAPDGWTPYVESLTKQGNVSRYGAPDGWTPYMISLTRQSQSQVVDGRSPDTVDAGQVVASGSGFDPSSPETRARLIAQGYIDGSIVGNSTFDGRSPDTKDFAQQAQLQNMLQIDGRSQDIRNAEQALQLSRNLTPVDGRSVDTVDAAVQAHSPVVTITKDPGFQWGDFGIGSGVALAAVILLALGLRLLSNRQGRKPTPVATA
jgi:hypothetical protein